MTLSKHNTIARLCAITAFSFQRVSFTQEIAGTGSDLKCNPMKYIGLIAITTASQFIPGSKSLDKDKHGFAILWRDILDIPSLNFLQKGVLCRIISAVDRGAVVSNQEIADGLGVHRDTINEALNVLEEQHFIRSNGRRGYGRRFETAFTKPTFSKELDGTFRLSKSGTPSKLDGTSRHNSIRTIVPNTVATDNIHITPNISAVTERGESEVTDRKDSDMFTALWEKYDKGSEYKSRKIWKS